MNKLHRTDSQSQRKSNTAQNKLIELAPMYHSIIQIDYEKAWQHTTFQPECQ